MDHRHLNHQRLTRAAIDSIIERGEVEDWLRLAREAHVSESVRSTVRAVCEARLGCLDPFLFLVKDYGYWLALVDAPESEEEVRAAYHRCHKHTADGRDLSPDGVLLSKPTRVGTAKSTWPALDAPLIDAPSLLFLDIDGVLHPYFATGGLRADRDNHLFAYLPRLEGVLREFPAVQIVVSSDWRKHHSLDELRTFFSADIGPRIIGVTPISPPGDFEPGKRQREVEQYLLLHGLADVPWVALDDEWDNYEPGANLVRCDDRFTDAEERALRSALSGDRAASMGERCHEG